MGGGPPSLLGRRVAKLRLRQMWEPGVGRGTPGRKSHGEGDTKGVGDRRGAAGIRAGRGGPGGAGRPAHGFRRRAAGVGADGAAPDAGGPAGAVVKAVLDYCELDWHSSCLEFPTTTHPTFTASSHQVKLPLYKGSVGGGTTNA